MRRKKPHESLLVSFSAVENYPHIIFPSELNGDGEAFGGLIFSLMDRLAGTVFRLHSGMRGVTASYDEGEFIRGVKQGDLLVLRAAVNRVWNTSCEIGVKAFLVTVGENRHIFTPVHRVYFTYVSREFDENDKRKPIPAITPQTPEEQRRFREAAKRRSLRLLRKKRKIQKASL